MNILFLDTETTGNQPGKDRLCSVAYKINGELHHEFFKPPGPISIDAMATHHITEKMVADKPAFQGSETFTKLQELLPQSTLVAHNAPFDISMLEIEGLQVPQHICTLRVARHLDNEGKIPRFSLQYLRYLLDLNVEGASAHDAAGDVLVLEALFNRLQVKMTPEEMVEVSQKPILFQRINFGKHKGKLLRDIAQQDKGYLQWLLRQKEESAAINPTMDDTDWIYSLKQHLAG